MGIGANAFGQGTNIILQIVSPLVFFIYWDPATYGSWLLLSALPAYLSMADVGMVAASGNKMTMAMGRNDISEANQVFQSAQLFMTIVCVALAVIVTPIIFFAPLPDYLTSDMRTALAALILSVLITLHGGLWEALFKATGRYAVGTMLSQMTRIAEWGGYMIGLLLFRDFSGVALCGLLARSLGTACSAVLAKRGDHSLYFGFHQASRAELLTMTKPALSFMAFPLANAMSFQGATLLVGAISGTSSVALFNSYRTIARVAVQATGIFSHALWPEFSRIAGHTGMHSLAPLFSRTALLGAVQSFILSVILYFLSPLLLRLWTHCRIEFVPSLMLILLIYAAIGGSWHVPRILLMSTNQHFGLAGWSLFAGGLSIALGWGMGLIWQVNGVAGAMLVSEGVIAILCTRLAIGAVGKPLDERESA